MKLRPALTIIELVLAVSLLVILSVPALIAFNNFRMRQALLVSAENFSSAVKRAHIFARESKDAKQWGVVYVNSKRYALMSRDLTGPVTDSEYDLENPVQFSVPNFQVWFDEGTGEIAAPVGIEINIPTGQKRLIEISKSGNVTSRIN